MDSTKLALRQKKVALPSLGQALLRALLFTLGLMLILLLAAATFAYGNEDPTAYIAPLSYGISLFSAFFCGFICAKMRKRQGLFCGLLSGAGVVLLFVIGLFVFAGGEADALSLLLFYAILFLLAVFGGIVGGMQRVGGRKRRRR